MLEIPAQPVELPDHHGVAGADVLHQGGQAGTVIAGAGHGVGEGLCHAHRFEGSVLLIEGLGDGAYPHVPDPLALGHYPRR